MEHNTEKFSFQAESRQLLNLMVHSVYSNKEIFLRELISNASDAIDRLRFEAITKPELITSSKPFEIRIEADRNARTLTIIDNGIGMNHDDLVNHIGTIARSGTQEFIKKLKENKSNSSINDMIGQFGVGFYSAFMVADRVSIETRKAGENEAYRWESDGQGEYTITPIEKEEHGTKITLYLKPVDEENGIDDFTDFYVISNIVKKYSDFINYPIIMKEEREEIEKDKDGKPKKDGKKEKVIEDRILNSMKPIWTRPVSEVKPEEYKEFYRHITHDWNEPLKTIAYRGEGTVEFYSLLFIPSHAPFDFYYQGYKSGLQLYVKKVLIMEAFEDLLPKYLRFIKGVVDSPDLPLNISREILQKDRSILQIKKSLTKKILDSLQEMLNEDKKSYLNFWQEFGTALKEGVIADFENREKILSLLLYDSSHDSSKPTSLDEYISRMKEGQNEIYYINAESRSSAENSPHLEALKEKGFEVLYMVSPVDEIMMQSVTEYKGKKFKSAAKGNLELGNKEEQEKREKEIKEKQNEFSGLLKWLGEKLEKNIKEVRISSRLVNAPACIVSEDYDISPHLERIIKRDNESDIPLKKRILEINPDHPVLTKMNESYKKNRHDPLLSDYAELLLGYALLAEGAELPDPVKFNKTLLSLMEKNLIIS